MKNACYHFICVVGCNKWTGFKKSLHAIEDRSVWVTEPDLNIHASQKHDNLLNNYIPARDRIGCDDKMELYYIFMWVKKNIYNTPFIEIEKRYSIKVRFTT